MWKGGKGIFGLPMGGADWFQGLLGEAAGWPAPPLWGDAGVGWPGYPPAEAPWVGCRGPGKGKGGKDGYNRRRRRSRSRGEKSRDKSRGRSRSRSSDPDKTTDSIILPRQLMGRVIGKQGATINDIRDRTEARIDAEDRDDDKCEFRIRGAAVAVEKAKTMILDIADRASGGAVGGRATRPEAATDGEVVSDTLDFPTQVTGGIIGAKGVKINDVRFQSGAKVQVDKLEDRCQVLISGTPEQVERARTMVRSLAEETQNMLNPPGEPWGAAAAGGDAAAGGGTGGDDAEVFNDVLEFPVGVTGGIIGSKGVKISEVRQQSGARVTVEKLEDRCKVHMAGTPEQVQRARVMVISLADGEGTGGTGGGQRSYQRQRAFEAEDVMEVPQSMVGRVIGRGGETIQRLQRESGARLDVTTGGGDPCPVRITGSRESVSRARFLISELLERGGQGSGQPSAEAWQAPPAGGFWGCGGPDGPTAWFAGGPAASPFGGDPSELGCWPPQWWGADPAMWQQQGMGCQMPPLPHGGGGPARDYQRDRDDRADSRRLRDDRPKRSQRALPSPPPAPAADADGSAAGGGKRGSNEIDMDEL